MEMHELEEWMPEGGNEEIALAMWPEKPVLGDPRLFQDAKGRGAPCERGGCYHPT